MTVGYTPAELSSIAIASIKSHPKAHNQGTWHTNQETIDDKTFAHPCGTAHCWAGHIDLILGVPDTHTTNLLYHEVMTVMGMQSHEWLKITATQNSIARIEAFHKKYFVDGIFGEDGYDSDGYNEYGYDSDGYNQYGYNSDGYNEYGYNSDGYNRGGYDEYGYDENGYNEYGYDEYGYDAYGYDEYGYDENGYNESGYGEDGYDSDGYNQYGYNRKGYDENGYSREGDS
jgi:hypothetical protein